MRRNKGLPLPRKTGRLNNHLERMEGRGVMSPERNHNLLPPRWLNAFGTGQPQRYRPPAKDLEYRHTAATRLGVQTPTDEVQSPCVWAWCFALVLLYLRKGHSLRH